MFLVTRSKVTAGLTNIERFLSLSYLNDLTKNILFTSEIGNETISFFDLQITITDNELEYQIFRKPTFTDTVLPFYSNHPMNTKLSAFYSMINRLIRTSMNIPNFNSELKTTHTIAINNGYDIITLENFFRKTNRKFMASKFHTFESKPDKIYKRLHFISGRVSNPIARILQKNNLSSKLVNNKLDNIDTMSRSGVYELSCGDCDAVYTYRFFWNALQGT